MVAILFQLQYAKVYIHFIIMSEDHIWHCYQISQQLQDRLYSRVIEGDIP